MSDNNVLRFSNNMRIVSDAAIDNVVVTDENTGGQAKKALSSRDEELNSKIEAAFQQGWKTCEKQMNEKINALSHQLEAALKQIPASLKEYMSELEKQMKSEVGDLAFSVAAMVLGHEVNNMAPLRSLVDEMLSPIIDLNGVTLYLNPEMASKAGMPGGTSVPAGIKVLPDSRLKTGEALVESPQGIIDGTLDGRISALKDAFDRFLEEHNSSEG